MASRSLPTIGEGRQAGWQRQRAAAGRNQQAILDAAGALFRRQGVEQVDVRQIAAAAGVGVGTVYRHFESKANVIAALLGERERALQDALLSGPPPLGPGAPAGERLAAFLTALAQLTEQEIELLHASEGAAAGARHRVGSYRAWRQHVAILLGEIDPRLDAEWWADALLAPLGAALYRQQRRSGMSAERIEANLLDAARRISPAGP
jgi:AcrR family transcriptional regulator